MIQAGFAISIIAALFYGGRLIAAAIHVGVLSFKAEKDGYRSVAMSPGYSDEEDGLCPECAAALEKERFRHYYGEALSPVLAFFPEDVR